MRCKFNISIDDVSPHPKSSELVVERCFELIEIFNDIKFTLFVPAAYWRTIKPGTTTESPLFLYDYPEFCSFLKLLPSKNFEIGYHGYYHGIPGQNDNNEFYHISKDEAKKRISLMKDAIERAGLKDVFKSMFRPPAWNLGPQCFDSFSEMGIDLLALGGFERALKVYDGKDKDYKKVTYANMFPPFKQLQLLEKSVAVYHACEWDQNHLNKDNTLQLLNFLKENEDKIEFNFMEGLV